MTGVLDNAPLDLTCPDCLHEFTETVGRLKHESDYPCPAKCGHSFDTTEISSALAALEEAVHRLGQELERGFA